LNAGEFGVVFRFGVGFSLVSFTTLSLTFTRPDGSTVTATNPNVAVGSGDVSTSLGTFLNGQYATYTFASGDISLPGTYQVRLTYQDASPKKLVSTIGTFQVGQ
jgi:hypothetical protein